MRIILPAARNVHPLAETNMALGEIVTISLSFPREKDRKNHILYHRNNKM